MAAGDPNPGKTPTNVPKKTPRRQKNRFVGRKATLKPTYML
jgi:hypothetical protein